MSSAPPSAAARSPLREHVARHPVLLLALAAVVLRFLVFLGRGDYVAFDEGWYLLLGRNVWSGDGYTLSGLRHVTLSPLFPLLSGAAGALGANAVWAGRLIAALAAGLLVVPCWHIFERIAQRRTALFGCALVAALPSLAAFAAPYWIGWDLWVGAEPLLHLLLFTGMALLLRARDAQRWHWWALGGVAFGAAYLARPEGILIFGLIGTAVGIEQLVRRNARGVRNALICALAFALTATPYWLYLREHLGRWSLTGRVIEMPAAQRGTANGGGAAATIEGMLWGNDEQRYVDVLYGLNADASALSSTYWGLPAAASRTAVDGVASSSAEALPQPSVPLTAAEPAAPDAPAGQTANQARPPRGPSRVALYLRALAVVVPWYLWPLALFGIIAAGPRRRAELLVALPLVVTSIAIARIVATDPRTQLFMAPLIAFYTARGLIAAGERLDRRSDGLVRPGFATAGMAIIALAILLGTQARWVVMGRALGSPHHLVGSANRAMGAALQHVVPPGEPVMSWHPAIALYAERDWRVLPQADLPRLVRYANSIGCEYIVLSQYYPGPELMPEMPREHILLHVPPGSADVGTGWQLVLTAGEGPYMLARLQPPNTAALSSSEPRS